MSENNLIDPAIVARYGLGGAALGMGTMAALNLAHHIKMLRDERKRRVEPTATDKDTIVLTIPRKNAEAPPAYPAPAATSGVPITTTETAEYHLNPNGKQSRNVGSGQYGEKYVSKAAATGWPTLTAAMLASLAGAGGGAAIMDSIYRNFREKQLRNQEEAARQEYLQALTGGVKESEFISALNVVVSDEKQASNNFGTLSYPLAAAAVMTILGAGATVYITKRVLDENVNELDNSTTDQPKVKRIIFRSEPNQEEDKNAGTVDDIEAVAGALLIMMDKVAGTRRFLGDEEVVKAATAAGTDADTLIKQAQEIDSLIAQLQQPGAADLKKSLYNVYNKYSGGSGIMDRLGRFFKGIALKTDVGQNMADNKLYTALMNMRDGVGGPGMAPAAGVPKLAASALTAGLGGLVGMDMFTQSMHEMDPEELATLIAEAQRKIEAEEELTLPEESVNVSAADPNAEEYVDSNRARIKAVLANLSLSGAV